MLGTSQHFLGVPSKLLVVPATQPLAEQAPGGDTHFKVKYRTQSLHRVLVNFAAAPPTIQIQSEADVCAGVCPPGLTCQLPQSGVPVCVETPPTGPWAAATMRLT